MNDKGGQPKEALREAWRLFGPLWKLMTWGALIGVLGGLSTAWLLIIVNQGLHSGTSIPWSLLATFCILCVLSGCGSAIAGAVNTVIGQQIVSRLRKDIARRIVRSPIAAIEAAGSHRLLTTLTSDVDTISAFLFNFAGYAVALAIALGSFVYLFLVSRLVFLLSLIAVAIGVLINIRSHRTWISDFEKVRVEQDELYKLYRAVTEGNKELKMNRPRRGHIVGHKLFQVIDRIALLKNRAMRLYWISDAAGSTIYFVVIGLLLAIRHELPISDAELSGAVIILLYAKAPIEQIAGALPVFDQARISCWRIAALSAEIERPEPGIDLLNSAPISSQQLLRSIELRDVCYEFPPKAGVAPFRLGPINLRIAAGEMIFVVGDNGSGKTTLLKLLLGLYEPQRGELLLDGAPITTHSRDEYRQLFSVIFSDYFLFDSLSSPSSFPQGCVSFLEKLEIAHKVSLSDELHSIEALSTGQKKRLALVHAFSENRSVLVTDEWAADQDPTFRRVFYEEILPDLKSQGKTLIVISHDDRYFDVADRVIVLSDGKLNEHQIARSG